jgi:glycosyltransferase involved in cell wall biosynthesis
MTAREAMAYGRPVVATRVGGLADLAGDGVELVTPRDSAALRAAVELLLASPQERDRRGGAARAFALETFAEAPAAAALVAAYEDVCAAKLTG